MSDKFTPEKRREIMSRVRGKDTKPEKLVRSLLHNMGYRFRLHRKDLPGKPDIVLPKHHKVVFVHGCFWHGHEECRRAARPATNAEFWNKKIDGNIKRDAQKLEELKATGWHALTIWQCELRDLEALRGKIDRFLKGE